MLNPLRIKLFSQYKFKKCHQVSICHNKKLLPYFIIHLEQVVTAYNRGQNFRDNELDPNIEPLGLTADEQAGLVAFLKTLTDPRGRNEAAPFDRPQINIPNGHPGDEIAINARSPNNQTIASDDFRLIKATGASGPAGGHAGRSIALMNASGPIPPTAAPPSTTTSVSRIASGERGARMSSQRA